MKLIWVKSAHELLDKAEESSIYNFHKVYSGPFPYVDADTGHCELTNARITKVMVGEEEYAVVVLCRIAEDDTPRWAIYCGDPQVSGKEREAGKKLAAQCRSCGYISNGICNRLEASEWVGSVAEQGACGFFRMQQRHLEGAPWKICRHTASVLHQMTQVDFDDMASDLKDWFTGADVDSDTVEMAAEEEAFYDAAFVQHVLLAGERGSGKSYLARQAADKYDAVYLEMQMHPSMEAWEFRAHDRAWNGKVYTVLGKLAEAVYWIQQGKRVVLCMDEFLNMNPIYTTVINSPLTLTANDTYLIETGRIIDMGDGVGRVETVEVPSDMLWVVATTNIGARYNIDKMPPSVRARFQIILMNTNAKRTASILEKNLKKYDMPAELAEMFRVFIERCHQSVIENTLDEEATTRLACNVIRAVHKKAIRDKKKYSSLAAWLSAVKKQVMLEVAQVVNFDSGPLDEEQTSLYLGLVNACFRVKGKGTN